MRTYLNISRNLLFIKIYLRAVNKTSTCKRMKRSKLYTAYLPALFSFLGLLYFQIFCLREYPDIFVFFAAYLALSYWLIVRRNYKCGNFPAVCLRAYLLQLAIIYFSSVAVLILCIFTRNITEYDSSLLLKIRYYFGGAGFLAILNFAIPARLMGAYFVVYGAVLLFSKLRRK